MYHSELGHQKQCGFQCLAQGHVNCWASRTGIKPGITNRPIYLCATITLRGEIFSLLGVLHALSIVGVNNNNKIQRLTFSIATFGLSP